MRTLSNTILIAASLAFFSCESKAGTSVDAPFEYREIYLPEHTTDAYREAGLNNLDDSWGIWGHNLARVLPEEHSHTVYAKDKEGNSNTHQFCFSSNHLYEYIVDFVKDNYGEHGGVNFAILPNDNSIVCLCERCEEAGNVPGNAAPAVDSLLIRLAERFPEHTFFTSYYSTTKALPAKPLPPNTGVLISAIDYPLSYDTSVEERDFEELLLRWNKLTGHVYVWDYINNFDDYFTPYPVFGAMQRRLKMYRDSGVKGVFLNGSGEDYSMFSKLKTYVVNELLKDPDTDWKAVLREKSNEFYPTVGDIIADFMIAQEDFVADNHTRLPLYKGVSTALHTYLPQDEFIAFQDEFEKKRSSASGDEGRELDIMSKALELPRLEIMRITGNTDGFERRIARLNHLDINDGVHSYNENGWEIKPYIQDYGYLTMHQFDSKDNKLKGQQLEALNAMDPDYTDIALLTDGMLGMPCNYHNGLLINSPEDKWRVAVPINDKMKTLRVWMVTNPALRLALPEKINLLVSGVLHKRIFPTPDDQSGHTFIDFALPPGAGNSVILEFVSDPDAPTFAIEEIEAY